MARGAKWNAANKWLLSPRWIENLVCKHKYHLITTISIQIDPKDPGGHTDDKTIKIPRHSQFCRQPPQAPPTHKSYNRKGGVSSPKLSDLKFNITSNYQFVCSCSIERLFGWSRRNFSEEEISNRQSITVSPPCQETINCSSFFIAAKIWEFAKSACWLGFHLDGIPNFKSKFILGRFFFRYSIFYETFQF